MLDLNQYIFKGQRKERGEAWHLGTSLYLLSTHTQNVKILDDQCFLPPLPYSHPIPFAFSKTFTKWPTSFNSFMWFNIVVWSAFQLTLDSYFLHSASIILKEVCIKSGLNLLSAPQRAISCIVLSFRKLKKTNQSCY